ncbi:lipopolysaccharide transport periplasmic protein LptA [Thalassotalea agarivorans]|uniref:Lipopolysaccharide export system protein LptA n=1 Tax=Thalassotalea agarivorans TaxID=349064 RepID=A0A1I0FSY7_THASX|nr:lipopolysaccharide transport periplasmic protein LptA [Thalassotalea agarivorans]SET61354.1 lipopolysaccharide export system protein LptA [Thalassotalea agarivorans]
MTKQLHMILAALLLNTNLVLAEEEASEAPFEPVKITSNEQSGDLKKRIVIYQDNVRIVQGTLLITADTVQAQQNIETGDQVYTAQGKPARFEKTLEDNFVEMEAEKIVYEPAKNLVTITGNAQLSDNAIEVKADFITYNTLTQKQTAKSLGDNETVTTIKELPKKN